MKIGISCGGTGGHIFPGLATGEALKARGHEVVLWLAGREVEKASVSGWNGPVISVKAEGLPSGLSLRSIRAAWTLFRAYRTCLARMRAEPPAALFATGSYASVGPVLAAHKLRVPVVLHESNVIPGRAVQLLSRYATSVAIGFAEARPHFRHTRVVLTGFPVREPQGLRFAANTLADGLFTLLVTGGSQGAHVLNEVAAEAVCDLHRNALAVQVIHLTGARDRETVEARYREAAVRSLVFDFLKDMEQAYAAATLAVCRAGAATCAELAVYGVPSLLVPLPTAARGHQLANARALQDAGASDVMLQDGFTSAGLASYVEETRGNAGKLAAMREAAHACAVPNAAARIADLVEQAATAPRA